MEGSSGKEQWSGQMRWVNQKQPQKTRCLKFNGYQRLGAESLGISLDRINKAVTILPYETIIS